jgi:hypothetical protein
MENKQTQKEKERERKRKKGKGKRTCLKLFWLKRETTQRVLQNKKVSRHVSLKHSEKNRINYPQ